MRPLTESETKVVFDKLATFCGQSLKQLIAPDTDGDRYVFRSATAYIPNGDASLADFMSL